jgi:hypothetical protein
MGGGLAAGRSAQEELRATHRATSAAGVPCRPSTAPASGRTAAEVFWRQPDSSMTATGTAVAALIQSAFPGRLGLLT